MDTRRRKLANVNMAFGLVTTLAGVVAIATVQYRGLGVLCLAFGLLEIYAALTLLRPRP